MKIIQVGATYQVYGNDLTVHDSLPAKTYSIRFSKLSGFSLEERPGLEVTERVFGSLENKAAKVMRSFADFQRSLGVILSGPKGIGKSLFSRLLCCEAVAAGLPVIVVDTFYPGISSFLSSIRQEALILFDEFDKTFGNIRTGENTADPQAGLLSLFDGTESGKWLFVITCNELRSLNDFLINRPGRFHYHFRFEAPDAGEVRAYMDYLLRDDAKDQIDKVVAFAGRVGLNYDCLRAVAFELNHGETFENALKDLNIVNTDPVFYDVTLYCENGQLFKSRRYQADLYSGVDLEVGFHSANGQYVMDVNFDPSNCVYDRNTGELFVPAEMLSFPWYCDDKTQQDIEAAKPVRMTLRRIYDRTIHYAV